MLALLFAAAYAVLELAGVQLLGDETANKMLTGGMLRIAASVLLVVAVIRMRIDCMGFQGCSLKNLAVVAPCLLISLNNFPWIDALGGKLSLTRPELVALLALECLSVGLFEELFFRGIVFPHMLRKRSGTKEGIFRAVIYSSALFSAYHLLNLFAGSGFGAVAMQMGYTFLFGGMLCFVLLWTKNIWLCALLHAVYNFGGMYYSELGTGNIWSLGTILLTVFVSLAVAAYIAFVFIKRKLPYATELLPYRENAESGDIQAADDGEVS